MPRPRIKRIIVNRNKIDRNRKTGSTDAPITVKCGGKNWYVQKAYCLGPSTVKYDVEHPLSCGATVWVECTCPVELDNGEVIH